MCHRGYETNDASHVQRGDRSPCCQQKIIFAWNEYCWGVFVAALFLWNVVVKWRYKRNPCFFCVCVWVVFFSSSRMISLTIFEDANTQFHCRNIGTHHSKSWKGNVLFNFMHSSPGTCSMSHSVDQNRKENTWSTSRLDRILPSGPDLEGHGLKFTLENQQTHLQLAKRREVVFPPFTPPSVVSQVSPPRLLVSVLAVWMSSGLTKTRE